MKLQKGANESWSYQFSDAKILICILKEDQATRSDLTFSTQAYRTHR